MQSFTFTSPDTHFILRNSWDWNNYVYNVKRRLPNTSYLESSNVSRTLYLCCNKNPIPPSRPTTRCQFKHHSITKAVLSQTAHKRLTCPINFIPLQQQALIKYYKTALNWEVMEVISRRVSTCAATSIHSTLLPFTTTINWLYYWLLQWQGVIKPGDGTFK